MLKLNLIRSKLPKFGRIAIEIQPMSFWDRLFRKKKLSIRRAPIQFGRYNEGLRTPERYSAWDKSMDLFAEGDFLNALEQVMIYLNHQDYNNVSWKRVGNKIDFSLEQGSMEVNGWANALEFQAEAKVCEYISTNEKLFLSLLEANYDLTYCKYVLQEKAIVLKFNSHVLDASPYKIYNGLRELALLADKQDDLYQGEYIQDLSPPVAWINPLPEAELSLKRAFLEKQAEELESNYQHCALDPIEYSGAFAYLILNTCYKLDYLLRPEGELMDIFERVHRGYFGPEGTMSSALNDRFFEQVLVAIRSRLPELHKECYQVNYTFGYTTAVSLERVQSFVLEEVEKMDWYIREGHREIGLAIPGYIVGYSLFHYALPAPLTELFGLYYEISEASFYTDLGFSPALLEEGALRSDEILQRIQDILAKDFGLNKSNLAEILRFDSIYHFSKSYLKMIGNLSRA